MEWTDRGIVVAVRPHGESAVILSLLTPERGRHVGLVRGGRGRRVGGVYQPGNLLRATWRARLAEHMGSYSCELERAVAAEAMDNPDRLAALTAACAVAEWSLPERETHRPVHDGLLALIDALPTAAWPTVYVKWELGLLRELGFGLDLSRCAATGANDGLIYVSPRTGRAVSSSAGEPYRDRLLPLPDFLLRSGSLGEGAEIADGLRLTGHFLEHHVFASRGHGLPAARDRLAERMGSAWDGRV